MIEPDAYLEAISKAESEDVIDDIVHTACLDDDISVYQFSNVVYMAKMCRMALKSKSHRPSGNPDDD